MVKVIIRSILGGTVGMAIIGFGTGQWLLGAGFCYAISLSFGISKYLHNKKKQKQ